MQYFIVYAMTTSPFWLLTRDVLTRQVSSSGQTLQVSNGVWFTPECFIPIEKSTSTQKPATARHLGDCDSPTSLKRSPVSPLKPGLARRSSLTRTSSIKKQPKAQVFELGATVRHATRYGSKDNHCLLRPPSPNIT